MYLRFANWAAEQRTRNCSAWSHSPHVASFWFSIFETHGLSPPPNDQGLQVMPCLGFQPYRQGRGGARIISDMIHSMKLERLRPTPVLPEWDQGTVLEALAKPSGGLSQALHLLDSLLL